MDDHSIISGSPQSWMNTFLIVGGMVTWLALIAGAWLCWQLLRQNGRMLLRLEDLENRLDELEFGEDEQPAGLQAGTEALDFELPDLTGKRHALRQYRGRPVLLIFFNPGCGFCQELARRLTNPELNRGSKLLIITSGSVEQNRAFFAEHELDCSILLQQHGEIATAYRANGTPSGYLISAEGKVASGLALGAEALLEIAAEPRSSRGEKSTSSITEPSVSKGHGGDQSLVTSAATSRFSNGSLARSKIKRDGLKAGTVAPDFRLPRLDGRGELALSDLRGRQVLLVFSGLRAM